jgi:hypothetical protein
MPEFGCNLRPDSSTAITGNAGSTAGNRANDFVFEMLAPTSFTGSLTTFAAAGQAIGFGIIVLAPEASTWWSGVATFVACAVVAYRGGIPRSRTRRSP